MPRALHFCTVPEPCRLQPGLDTRAIDLARDGRGKDLYYFGNQRLQFGHTIGVRMHHDDDHARRGEMLLKLQVTIDRDERVEPLVSHTCEEPSVLAARPAEINDMRDVESRKLA